MTTTTSPLSQWSDMFPEGRFIYYEGYHPTDFALEMLITHNFDPRECRDRLGGKTYTRKRGYGFHCPVHALDDVYGSGRFPMGS